MIGKNLISLREASKLSQEDVAHALNMTRPSYKQLETGLREPSNVELKAISELFGVRTESILASDSKIDEMIKDLYALLNDDGVADTVDKVKYKNLILYFAERIGALPNVGETVFYKMLYFAETLSLHKFKKSIVGEQFVKRQYGPVPKSFRTITNKMIADNELDKMMGRYYTYMQTKYLPRSESSGLTTEERSIADDVIRLLGTKSATELSDLSHQDSPWIDAKDGDIIDLNLISKTPTEIAMSMGRQ
ncbi:MAG: type II toxin-antitoxin system antitoxin SocA domain-containing protein [Candidatus Saccharimonadales bacterium]